MKTQSPRPLDEGDSEKDGHYTWMIASRLASDLHKVALTTDNFCHVNERGKPLSVPRLFSS